MQEKNKFTASILINAIKEINGKTDRMSNQETQVTLDTRHCTKTINT
jgi:hypothetical protein